MPKDGPVAVPVEEVTVRSFCIPTDAPESDGTIAWDATTMVVVEVSAAGQTGLGYTYSAAAAASIVAPPLTSAIVGQSACNIPLVWTAMVGAVRNVGWRGVSACAISAVDVA